jgi:hypothetical protein
MPSYSEPEDKVGRSVVRTTNSAQQANALDMDEYTCVLALTSPIAFSLGDTEISCACRIAYIEETGEIIMVISGTGHEYEHCPSFSFALTTQLPHTQISFSSCLYASSRHTAIHMNPSCPTSSSLVPMTRSTAQHQHATRETSFYTGQGPSVVTASSFHVPTESLGHNGGPTRRLRCESVGRGVVERPLVRDDEGNEAALYAAFVQVQGPKARPLPFITNLHGGADTDTDYHSQPHSHRL